MIDKISCDYVIKYINNKAEITLACYFCRTISELLLGLSWRTLIAYHFYKEGEWDCYGLCALPWCRPCWQSGVFLWSEGQFPAPQSPLWGNGRSTDQYPEIMTHSQNKRACEHWTNYWCTWHVILYEHDWNQSYHILLCFFLQWRVLFAIYWHCPYHKTQRQKQQPLQASCHPWTPLDTTIRPPLLSQFRERESGFF